MKSKFRLVAAIMPPNTVVPTETRPAAPAPRATTSGTTPRMNASEVIRMGRSRMRAASMAASTMLIPFSRSCSANSTIKIAFLLDSPINITRPIWQYTSFCDRRSAPDNGAQQRHRHRQQHDERQDKALILRRQSQVDEGQTEGKERGRFAAGLDLFQRHARPFDVNSIGH